MKLKVYIDGIKFDLECSKGDLIPDVLEKNNIPYPGSCQVGICSSCKCKVLSGKSEMLQNYVLTDKEIESGYILACQGVIDNDLEIDFDY